MARTLASAYAIAKFGLLGKSLYTEMFFAGYTTVTAPISSGVTLAIQIKGGYERR
jgi:hypothetical protein